MEKIEEVVLLIVVVEDREEEREWECECECEGDTGAVAGREGNDSGPWCGNWDVCNGEGEGSK